MHIKVYNINWDMTDDSLEKEITPEEARLPSETTLDVDDAECEGMTADEIQEYLSMNLADNISDLYGYCVHGFDFEVLDLADEFKM